MVCGILISCASCSGGERSTNNYMERDKLMGFQYLIWSEDNEIEHRCLPRFHFDFEGLWQKSLKRKCWKLCRTDFWCYWKRLLFKKLKTSSPCMLLFHPFLVKVPLMHDNVKYYFHIYLTQIRIKLKNATGIWRRWNQIFIQRDFKKLFFNLLWWWDL